MSLSKQNANPFENLCYDVVNYICGYINDHDRMVFNNINKKNYIEHKFKSSTKLITRLRDYKSNLNNLVNSTVIRNLKMEQEWDSNIRRYVYTNKDYFDSLKNPLMSYIIFIKSMLDGDYSLMIKSKYISECYETIKYIITSGWFNFEKERSIELRDLEIKGGSTSLYVLIDIYQKFNNNNKANMDSSVDNTNNNTKYVDNINDILYGIIKLILDYGNNTKFVRVGKDTIFSNAVYKGTNESKIKLAKLLLDKNININETDGYNKTALQWCCNSSDNIPIIQYILDNGANINKMKNGSSCLYSCLHHHDRYKIDTHRSVENFKLFDYLIKNGANMYNFIDNKKTSRRYDNIFEYIFVYRNDYSYQDSMKFLNIMIDNGYDFNVDLNKKGKYILMININDNLRKWCLKHCNINVNIEITKGKYDNYLDFAITTQRIGLTRMLIKHGLCDKIITKELEKLEKYDSNWYKSHEKKLNTIKNILKSKLEKTKKTIRMQRNANKKHIKNI